MSVIKSAMPRRISSALLFIVITTAACAPANAPTRETTRIVTATPVVALAPTSTPADPTATATLVVRGTLPPIAVGTPTLAAAQNNPFGLMLGPDTLGIDKRLALIKSLRGAYFRPWDMKVDEWKGVCAECAAIERSGMRVLLTVRANGAAEKPTTPSTALPAYKKTLGDILDKRKPEILVVENEENSAQSFNTGTPQEYGVELKAACEVAHSKRIRCTNGGLDSGEIVLLVWANYLEQNNAGAGCAFARRGLAAQQAATLCNARTSAQLPPKTLADLNKGRGLIAQYKNAGADFVNFHWYVADPAGLEEAVAYLKKASGLPVLCNEMGQQTDEPSAMQPLLQKALDLGLPYVIWYSVDSPKARALNNADGSLRATGEAFQAFMQARFK